MKVLAICATHGRHSQMERSLGLFLNQDYQNKKLLIYQNSPFHQRLSFEFPEVTLVNNHIDPETSTPFSTLGAIYNACLPYFDDAEVITFWDDDDLFSPDHLSCGVSGLMSGGKAAYKPAVSYFRSDEGITLEKNVLEPSIFVSAEHIKKWKFSLSTGDQHLQWVNPLVQKNDIFIDNAGKPTLMYNWSSDENIFKTSGNSGNPENFGNFRKYSQDHGDYTITPTEAKDLKKYFSLFP